MFLLFRLIHNKLYLVGYKNFKGVEIMLDLTETMFHEEVLNADKLVLVDFWAPWCGPCRMVGPILEQLASEYQELAKVVKVNVDENGALASKYGVMSIPTIIFFKDGQEVERLVGAMPKTAIEGKLEHWTK